MNILIVEPKEEGKPDCYVRKVNFIPRQNDILNLYGTLIADITDVIVCPNRHIIDMITDCCSELHDPDGGYGDTSSNYSCVVDIDAIVVVSANKTTLAKEMVW